MFICANHKGSGSTVIITLLRDDYFPFSSQKDNGSNSSSSLQEESRAKESERGRQRAGVVNEVALADGRALTTGSTHHARWLLSVDNAAAAAAAT